MTPDDLDRLRTIIDEAFGMQPPIADADLLTELERLLRDQGSALQSALLRIEQQEAVLSKPEDARLRDVIAALDGRAVMLESPGDRVRWILRELDEWITRAGAAERERDRLRKLFDDAGQGEHNGQPTSIPPGSEVVAPGAGSSGPIWRTGTRNPHTLYRDDKPAGFVLDPALGAELVSAGNGWLSRSLAAVEADPPRARITPEDGPLWVPEPTGPRCMPLEPEQVAANEVAKLRKENAQLRADVTALALEFERTSTIVHHKVLAIIQRGQARTEAGGRCATHGRYNCQQCKGEKSRSE